MNIIFRSLTCASLVLTCALLAIPAEAHFDIFVTNLGTQTGIGGADVDGGVFTVDTRVFEGVMIAGSTPDYSRNEPGFFALSGLAPSGLFPSGASALPAGAAVALNFNPFAFNGNVSDLFYWDGAGVVDFQPAAGVNVSLSDAVELAGANGELDFHPAFEIDDPLGTAANGVYLASLTAAADGLAPSDPIYLVWLVDSSITDDEIAEEVEEATEAGTAFPYYEEAVGHVELSLVPEPATGTAALLAACGGLAWIRGRRK